MNLYCKNTACVGRKEKKKGEDGEHFIVYGLYLTALLTVCFRCFALKLNIKNAE